MTQRSPFRYFKTSPEIIRLAVMLYVRYPLSLRNVEDLLHERGIEISHETVRFWWNRFGPMFAAEIRKMPAPCKINRSSNNSLHNQSRPHITAPFLRTRPSQPKRTQTQSTEAAEHATMSGSWTPRSAS